LRNYAGRVADRVLVVHDALFRALPERLACLILAKAEGGVLQTTHEAIAIDLGSAREVVSRLLWSLERETAIESGRGLICVKDAAPLRPY
jgi:CRP/FNR family transcriptional regulator, anaerobic regulatory protein